MSEKQKNLSKQARQTLARLTRALPNFRGLGRLYRALNSFFLKSGAPPIDVAHMSDGSRMVVDLRTWTEVQPFYRGSYDQNILSIIKSLIDSSDLFFDVGAHIGFYSVPIAFHIKRNQGTGKVFSFEPHPNNFSRLSSNLSENDLTDIATCWQIALSDKEAVVDLVMREDFDRGGSTGNASVASAQSMDRGFQTTEVETTTLDKISDQILSSGERVGFIKIDIEGHEDQFLDGARRVIREHKPGMMMEINRRYYHERDIDPTEAIETRLPHFYRFFQVVDGELIPRDTLAELPDMSNAILLPAK